MGGHAEGLRRTMAIFHGAAQAFPPEISFFGASPSQEQKCFSSGHLRISVPISDTIVWAIESLIPCTATRATPGIRRICARVFTAGAFLLWEWGLRRGGVEVGAGLDASHVISKRGLMTEKTCSLCASHALSGVV